MTNNKLQGFLIILFILVLVLFLAYWAWGPMSNSSSWYDSSNLLLRNNVVDNRLDKNQGEEQKQ